eukprot:scaffold37483_cov44-Phaeocystis_antarctica.AAC.1
MLLACFCPAASIPFGLKGSPLSVTASAAGDRLQLLLQHASADDQPLGKGQSHQDTLPLTLELERESDTLSGTVVLVDPNPNPSPSPNPNPNLNLSSDAWYCIPDVFRGETAAGARELTSSFNPSNLASRLARTLKPDVPPAPDAPGGAVDGDAGFAAHAGRQRCHFDLEHQRLRSAHTVCRRREALGVHAHAQVHSHTLCSPTARPPRAHFTRTTRAPWARHSSPTAHPHCVHAYAQWPEERAQPGAAKRGWA